MVPFPCLSENEPVKELIKSPEANLIKDQAGGPLVKAVWAQRPVGGPSDHLDRTIFNETQAIP